MVFKVTPENRIRSIRLEQSLKSDLVLRDQIEINYKRLCNAKGDNSNHSNVERIVKKEKG